MQSPQQQYECGDKGEADYSFWYQLTGERLTSRASCQVRSGFVQTGGFDVFFLTTEWFTWFIEDLCRCSAVGNSLLCFRFRIQSRASSSSTGGERTWRRSLNQLLFVTEVWPLTSACFCLVHKECVTFCPPLCKTTDYFNDHFLD